VIAAVGIVCGVQVEPFVEVRTVLLAPTAIKFVPS